MASLYTAEESAENATAESLPGDIMCCPPLCLGAVELQLPGTLAA